MSSLLGKMPPGRFLRDYWQKRPFLVRQAIPGFAGIVDRDALLELATRPDAVSRLVIEQPRARGKSKWQRHDGPFGALDVEMLPKDHWTLLVHGIESLIPGGWELLRAFSFIPAARIDDLMVSYATARGSVGPHEDRYDVFLLQGPGRRRWRIAANSDHVVDPDAAIKVLAHFEAEEEWLLEPGDMLYLPPSVAHWGVAEGGPCFTYSIGFLAPSHRELTQSFLGYLAQSLDVDSPDDTLLTDPDLQVQKEPFEVGDRLLASIASVLHTMDWDDALVTRFVGSFLTRPKPHVLFALPARALSIEAFGRRLAEKGHFRLALASRGLVRGTLLFLNGEAHTADRAAIKRFIALVNERRLPLPQALSADEQARYYAWYQAGYLQVGR